MESTRKSKKLYDRLLAVILGVVIVAAVVVLIYYAVVPEQKETITPSPSSTEVLLTVVYGEEKTNFTLKDLQSMESYTGYGGYKTKYPSVKGPFKYTGVNVTILLEDFDLPGNYTLKVTASDGWVSNYTWDQIMGNVTVYDINGNETGFGGVTMLLAYAEDGDYNFSDGPLRIAYVNEDEPITDSFLWAKYVVSMEIITEE